MSYILDQCELNRANRPKLYVMYDDRIHTEDDYVPMQRSIPTPKKRERKEHIGAKIKKEKEDSPGVGSSTDAKVVSITMHKPCDDYMLTFSPQKKEKVESDGVHSQEKGIVKEEPAANNPVSSTQHIYINVR
jgi:hypothetical protein